MTWKPFPIYDYEVLTWEWIFLVVALHLSRASNSEQISGLGRRSTNYRDAVRRLLDKQKSMRWPSIMGPGEMELSARQ